jgi:uncharacterized coiled-coil DUF342 family protein
MFGLYNPYDPTGALDRLRDEQNFRIREANKAARSWKEYAQKLEEKCIELAADFDAAKAIMDEVIDEAEGLKPRRLSIRANKKLRIQYANKVRRISEAKLIGVNPLEITRRNDR